jgi:hypothetical protein
MRTWNYRNWEDCGAFVPFNLQFAICNEQFAILLLSCVGPPTPVPPGCLPPLKRGGRETSFSGGFCRCG